MKNKKSLYISFALLLSLIGCTGINEALPSARLAFIGGNGSTLNYLDVLTSPSGDLSANITSFSISDGISLSNFNGGRNVVLVKPTTVEQLDAVLSNPKTFSGLNSSFSPCFSKSTTNNTKSRILILSDCSGNQKLAMYSTLSGSLLWSANLPLLNVAATSTTPPTSIAISGEGAVIARPSFSGSSEVIRIKYLDDNSVSVGNPVNSVAIRALAVSGQSVLAATDTGVKPLLSNDTPDSSQDSAIAKAFGSTRLDNLYTADSGSGSFIIGWQGNASSADTAWLWDFNSAKAVNFANIDKLNDLTLHPDGFIYAITDTTLRRFNVSKGLSQGIWSEEVITNSLNKAKFITWLLR